jgi:predicted nucleotidyltransferase
MAKMTLDELVSQLRAAFGTELRAVVLYGSAAAGEHNPKTSDYNVLVLVDSLAANRLQAASAVAKAWSEARNPAPLTLTLDEWRGSADIFPMEYADILERHRVLFGDLPADVRVDMGNLRLQLEREAMGALLQLRRGALAAGNDAKGQLELIARSTSTVMTILRAALRLSGTTPPRDNIELSQKIGEVAKLDASAFVQAVRHKRGEAIRTTEAPDALSRYLAAVQQLLQYLDTFKGRPT